MSHSGEIAHRANAHMWQANETKSDLKDICEQIRGADGPQAKLLPVQILSYMSKMLSRVEIDIHVEECLPMVCDACHHYVRSMGTFSNRHADHHAAEAARERLIQSLEILADEVRLCRPLSVGA